MKCNECGTDLTTAGAIRKVTTFGYDGRWDPKRKAVVTDTPADYEDTGYFCAECDESFDL